MSKEKYFGIDLFAGCGGLGEGFTNANINIIAHIEMNKWACESLKTRIIYHELRKIQKGFLYRYYLKEKISKEEIFSRFPYIKDIVDLRVIHATFGEVSDKEILRQIKKSIKVHGAKKVNLLLGGPPCQPYSYAGRSRDPSRMEMDQRHFLYKHYLKIIEELKPDFFVYENVPGLFSAKFNGERIFDKILDDFAKLTTPYNVIPPLNELATDPHGYVLNSSNFGVPQNRKRLLLIGYKKSLERSRPEINFLFQKLKSTNKKKRTVVDAIGDLPPIKPGNGKDHWFGEYTSLENLSPYQKIMRKFSPGIQNHKARPHMKSDLERYNFFIKHQKNGKSSIKLDTLIELRPDLIPHHKHLDKFLDRFKVQSWDKPSSTIVAHICKDGHYYIHPDDKQLRSFTVREAARCQSFPDNFKFEGPRTEQFRQVGNAVPPLLAKEIGFAIKNELDNIYV